MAQRVTYVGPHDEVWVPRAGRAVKRGESLEVPDALVDSLISQPAWELTPASTRPAKPAPQEA